MVSIFEQGLQRRAFLGGMACTGLTSLIGGCRAFDFSSYEPIANFSVPKMEQIRIGYIGVGERGTWAVQRIANIPGVEVMAICDLRLEQAEKVRKWLQDHKKTGPMRVYGGKDESWKALCEDPAVDVVYICTPAQLHARMEIYALECGKHVFVEVPGAQTVDECWAIVRTAEKARRHCMMLENCCYGEEEMLAWNLVHKGLLGTLTHAEGGYIHNLVWRQLETHFRTRHIQKPGTVVHRYGNTYPTHALGPICTYMDMNRGDRMETVVSLSSRSAAHREFAAATYPASAWQNNISWQTGDMNTSIIKTALGRTIMMQTDMSTPRPYSRINVIQGTKGYFRSFPSNAPQLTLSKKPGGDAMKFGEKEYDIYEGEKFKEIRKLYMHPLWQDVQRAAHAVGGHGGMDFMMDLRWIWCLRNGLPLDMDVYDLASWSSIVPCTAESDQKNGEPVELPDFTKGAWRTAKAQTIGTVDLAKMGFKLKG